MNAVIEEDSLDWDLDLGEGQRISLTDLLKYNDSGDEFEEQDKLAARNGQKVSDEDDSSSNSTAREQEEDDELSLKRRSPSPLPDIFQKKKRKKVSHRGSHRAGQKKPAGMPKRALSAYNVFFHKERPRIFAQSKSRIGFEELGKIIGRRWRNLTPKQRRVYEEEAGKDEIRYRHEMDLFDEVRRNRFRKPRTGVSDRLLRKNIRDDTSRPLSSSRGYKEAKSIPIFKPVVPVKGHSTPPPETLRPGSPDVVFVSPSPVRDVIRQPTRRVSYTAPPAYTEPYAAHPPTPQPSYSQVIYHPHQQPPLPPPQPVQQPVYACYPPPPYGYQVDPPPAFPTPRAPPPSYPPLPDLSRHDSSNHYHPYHQQDTVARSPPAYSPPPTSTTVKTTSSTTSAAGGGGQTMAVPSGMEVVIPDEHGRERRYRVTYNCFCMTRSEADSYMKSLGQEPVRAGSSSQYYEDQSASPSSSASSL